MAVRLFGKWTGAITAAVVALCASVGAGAQENVGSGLTGKPLQVKVTVKILEFQATKGLETGLSAYFQKLPRVDAHGSVIPNNNAIESADLTFPTSTNAGITVFLDRLRLSEGDIEVVLQALVDENRAFILSEPVAHVPLGSDVPTVVKTATDIPYESTRVVGNTAVQITEFKETGVTLNIQVPEMIDDDGNWETTKDTYINLDVNAQVKEEGQRIVVALDDQLAGGGDFSLARNAISVPEFISRGIQTKVWVREGQVLMMGGLYRNTESRTLATAPWLTQAEDLAISAAEQVVPGNFLASPLSSTIGNRRTEESRRELVFLIKAETWRPARSIMLDLGIDEEESEVPAESKNPSDVITDVIEGISGIPDGIAEGLTGTQRDRDSVDSNLGGLDE